MHCLQRKNLLEGIACRRPAMQLRDGPLVDPVVGIVVADELSNVVGLARTNFVSDAEDGAPSIAKLIDQALWRRAL